MFLGRLTTVVALFTAISLSPPIVLAQDVDAGVPAGTQEAQVEAGGAPEGDAPGKTIGIPADIEFRNSNTENPVTDFDAEKSILTLDKQWAETNGVTEGSILAVGRSPIFPEGLLVWADKIADSTDGQLDITTRPARLNEVMAGLGDEAQAEIAGQSLTGVADGVFGSVAGDDIAESSQASNDGVVVGQSEIPDSAVAVNGEKEDLDRSNTSDVEIYQPVGEQFKLSFKRQITKDSCDDGTFDYEGASLESRPTSCEFHGEGVLDADFEIAVNAEAALTLDTEGLLINEFSVLGNSGVSGHADVSVTDAIWGRLEWQVADLTFPFVAMAGPVPLTINVTVHPTVFLEVDADGNARASIGNLDVSYSDVGLYYSTRDGFEFHQGEPHFESSPPELTGSAALRSAVGVDPRTGVNLVGLVGVDTSVGTQVATGFVADPENPVCTIEVGMQGLIGLSEIALSKIPFIGWLLGGLEEPLNKLIRENAYYRWAYPNLYSSPNLCATNPISVGDQVWIDSNKDGVMDEGEPPLEGATVTLLRGVDASVADRPGSDEYLNAVVATTVTDAEGKYFFDEDPAFEGTAEGEHKGMLMPAHYTVVVDPPTPGGEADYQYADVAPHGFKATKNYVAKDVFNRTLEDLQRDSGGKYAWNTDNYSALMDGTRYQDRGAANPVLVDSEMTPEEAHEARLTSLRAYQAELAATNGYNDTVDFGFIPANASIGRASRVTGKAYIASESVRQLPAGATQGELNWLTQGTGVAGAEISFKPLRLESPSGRMEPVEPGEDEPHIVRTDVAGRFTEMLPNGVYEASIKSLPEGYELIEGAPTTVEVEVSANTSANLLQPDKYWVNFGVSGTPNSIELMTYIDTDNNGTFGSDDIAIPGAEFSVKHMATPIAGFLAAENGVAASSLPNSKGLVPWTLTAFAPAGRTFTDSATHALGKNTCTLVKEGTQVECKIRARDGGVFSDGNKEDAVASAAFAIQPTDEESTDTGGGFFSRLFN